MRSFAIFLGLIALALAGIALFTYPAWLLLQSAGLEVKFHRVASRIAMLTFLAGFVFLARRLQVTDRASLGYTLSPRQFFGELAKALLLGAVLMLPVLATMVLLDMRELKPGLVPGAADWAKLILMACVSGLVVALIEETAMRGIMHSAIARESGAVAAIVLVSLIYAATHFFAKTRISPEQVGPGSGLTMLSGILESFANPLGIIDAFLCLFMVGVLLGLVRHLTGNIAACVGLHASWVAIITVVRETSERREAAPAAWLMSDYDGFIGWMVLAWTFVLGAVLWRWYTVSRAVPGEDSRG
ncbi:MAG TPA: CPBP family intramembrane glutamic endopeptidase [Steroidobacteraceae bacterium]|nr:CPBP family intramembrane glutamic endopeptidase [Steroidobacteraceae bacterium]